MKEHEQEVFDVKDEIGVEETTDDIMVSETTSPFAQSRGQRLKIIISRWFLPVNLFLAVLIIHFTMNSGEVAFHEIFDIQLNWWWLVAGVGIIVLINIMEAARLQMIMKLTTGRRDFWLCLRTYILEWHYNLLTPMYSGGKAYKPYYLYKHGFTVPEISSISISNYVVGRVGYQLATGGIFFILLHRISDLDGSAILNAGMITGTVFTMATSVAIVLLAFGSGLPQKIVNLVLKLLFKTRFIKDKQKFRKKTDETMWRYRVNMRRLRKRPLILYGTIGIATLAFFLRLSLLCFIYASLFGWDWYAVPLLLLGIVLVEYTAKLMPLPGGTGAMEFAFLSMFASFISAPQIFVAVVIWKIATYVIPILNGIPVIIYNRINKHKFARNIDLSGKM